MVFRSEKVATRIEVWKRALIDLSRRNKLLNFKPSKASTVEVVDEIPQQILRQLLGGGTFSFDHIPEKDDEDELITSFEPVDVSSDPRWRRRRVSLGETSGTALSADHTDDRLQTPHTKKRLERNLLQISRMSQSSLEEQGVNTLFLALGMLEWYESDHSDIVNRAPILLVPVALARLDVSKPFRLSIGDDDPVLNPALVEKMRLEFQIDLPPLPDISEDVDSDEIFLGVKNVVSGLNRWDVTNDVALGLFSFHKFLMYRDLELNEKHFHKHSVVRALSGEDEGGNRLGLPTSISQADLDVDMSPWNSCQVVDADSSQQRAVLAIRKGHSLVIEGPPGTGKSQTITSLIAQALADGRTVLFVSEKMAALEVVKTRLESVGLGAYCLELHSNKVAKKAFVAELANSLDHHQQEGHDGADKLRRLQRVTGELQDYVVALHQPFGAIKRSPFDALGRLVALEDMPSMSCLLAGVAECSAEQLESLLDTLNELAGLLTEIGKPSEHALRGIGIKRAGRAERGEFEARVAMCAESAKILVADVAAFCEQLGFKVPKTLGDVELSLQAAGVMGRSPGGELAILQNPAWNKLGADVTTFLDAGDRFSELQSPVAQRFKDSVLETDLTIETDSYDGFRASAWRVLQPSFWKIRKYLRSFARPGYKPEGSKGFVTDLRQADECRRSLVVIKESDSRATELFGERWRGKESNWADLRQFADWVVELRAYALEEILTQKGLSLVSKASMGEQRVEEFGAAVEESLGALREALQSFAAQFEANEESGIVPDSHLVLDGVRNRLGELAQAGTDLRTWASTNVVLDSLQGSPVSGFLEELLDKVDPSSLVETFERHFYLNWLELVSRERPVLDDFRTSRHESRLQEFRDLDRESMGIAQRRVQMALGERRQELMSSGLASQLQLIQREARKSRRIVPVRKLLKQCPDVIQLIKPCFMMSPLSVAQFADPARLHFDLLVFDEASQIRPADAIGSFIRADQVVVVGDSKQLPPTDFFTSQVDTPEEMDPDEDLDADTKIEDDLQSILDEAAATAGIPSLRLKWHYRSEDESLIRFSNEEFYSDDPLYTFPSARPDSEDFGLKFEFVEDGIYEGKGVNGREAEVVADAVVDHIHRFPDLSLGVGTFGLKQQTRIQDELEQRRRNDPSLEFFFSQSGEGKFFVKNLENIQGDDRDVIFLSVTYGPDSTGRVRRRFGPINGENGWRRLNVITTRAKRRLHVFSSMRADDIDITGSISAGVEQLHRYLKYAETRQYPTSSLSAADTDSPFEDDIIAVLRTKGFKTVPQVGEAGYRIDIGVVDPEKPGRFICGVECDGASYHSAATVRDRDRLRQQVLELRGWQIHRVWSTDWFQDRNNQIDRLVRLIEKSKEDGAKSRLSGRPSVGGAKPGDGLSSAPYVPSSPQPGPMPAIEDIPVRPYRIAEPTKLGEAEKFLEEPASKLALAINRVVRVEGPIHVDELVRRVAANWGLKRSGSRITKKVSQAATAPECRGVVTQRGEFYWPAEMKVPIVRNRSIEGQVFSSDHICSEEAAEAVRLLLKHRAPLLREDVAKETARIFGFKRAGKKFADLIQQALDGLIEQGELRAGGRGVMLAK